MVEISLSGSGEGPGWVTAPGYSTAAFPARPINKRSVKQEWSEGDRPHTVETSSGRTAVPTAAASQPPRQESQGGMPGCPTRVAAGVPEEYLSGLQPAKPAGKSRERDRRTRAARSSDTCGSSVGLWSRARQDRVGAGAAVPRRRAEDLGRRIVWG
jgi:hypothetical protein